MTEAKFKFYLHAEYAELLTRFQEQLEGTPRSRQVWLRSITDLYNLFISQSENPVIQKFIQNTVVQRMAEKRQLLRSLYDSCIISNAMDVNGAITIANLKDLYVSDDCSTVYYR